MYVLNELMYFNLSGSVTIRNYSQLLENLFHYCYIIDSTGQMPTDNSRQIFQSASAVSSMLGKIRESTVSASGSTGSPVDRLERMTFQPFRSHGGPESIKSALQVVGWSRGGRGAGQGIRPHNQKSAFGVSNVGRLMEIWLPACEV